MPKQCKFKGCKNYVFAKNFCLNHQYLRDDIIKSIPKKSKKRAKQETKYSKSLKEKRDLYCIFCGKLNDDTIERHHLMGRENDLLNDSKYYRDAHHKCHMEDYHGLPYSEFMKLWYYPQFMRRLREIDKSIYEKYKTKEFKVKMQNKIDKNLDN